VPSLFRAGRRLVLVAPASAAKPGPGVLAHPIRVPSMGGFSVGTTTTTTSFTDTDVTATASAATVMLGPGQVFRIDTCLREHIAKKAPQSTCEQKVVDTTANKGGAIKVLAPTVRATYPRPAAGVAGSVTALVSISERQADGGFKQAASSSPSVLTVPPVGALAGSAPAGEGALLPHSPEDSGGVNTGLPDSFCAPTNFSRTAAPDAGVSTDALGPDAPAYYEVGDPTGAYAGRAPKGVMMVVHGGGWYSVGAGLVQKVRDEADRWRDRGWRTVSVTYRACGQSAQDVLWFHDRVRQLYGASVPLCLTGGSAGGHLALSVAWARPDVDCVIDEGGPTDALTLKDQRAWSATAPAGQLDGPRWAYNMMVAAWGQEDLRWYSPSLFKIRGRVLIGVAAHDPFVPYAQATELRDKQLARDPSAYVDTVQLADGDQPFVHANVSQAALDDFHAREDALVAPLVAQG
jgi:acetyl esterase/lipase